MNAKSCLALALLFLFLSTGIPLGAQDSQVRLIKVKVTAEQANLREKPDIGSTVVQQVAEGTILEADKKDGEWYLVRYTLEDGGVIAGYIHESLVTVVEAGNVPEAKPAGVIPAAPERRPTARPREPGQASETTAAAPGAPTPYEISLVVGGSSVIASDLNLGAQGVVDYNAAFLGTPATGQAGAVRMTYLYGIEAYYHFDPWLAIGLGVEYFRGANAKTVRYTGLTSPETLHITPSVWALPVKLNVRFYPGKDFYIRGSVGYYAVKAGYVYHFDQPDLWEEWKGSATSHGLGVEVALGGGWSLASNLRFFIEAGLRLAKFNNFKGQDVFHNSNDESTTESGPLWYFVKQGADGRDYPLLFIRGAKPSEAGVVDARKAVINLTGTAIKAGIRFRF